MSKKMKFHFRDRIEPEINTLLDYLNAYSPGRKYVVFQQYNGQYSIYLTDLNNVVNAEVHNLEKWQLASAIGEETAYAMSKLLEGQKELA